MSATHEQMLAHRYEATEQRCNRCRFWLPNLDSGNYDDEPYSLGHCRRYPPKVSDHMAAISIGTPNFGEQYDPEDLADSISVQRACLFPVTFCTDWCGEFRAPKREGH